MSIGCKKIKYHRRVGFIAVAMAFLLLFSTIVTVAQIATPQVEVGSKAEWFAPKIILMHTPGDEIFLGVVHPAAALFEKPFSIKSAIAEHRKYIELLREQGATVYTVIETLLEGTVDNQVFGLPRDAVVKDSWKNQEEMHLDTYFNIISPELAVMVELRMNTLDKRAMDAVQSKVDVYELEGDGYELTAANIEFQKFLEEEMGFKLIPVSRDDQLHYGINFLTIAPNKILAIDGVSIKYKQILKDAGVDAIWMDFHSLTGGYGAAHCTTQALLREDTATNNK